MATKTMTARDGASTTMDTETGVAVFTPATMIAVNDKVRYRAVGENRQQIAEVIAYVLAVHDEDTIDLGWRGDGWIHPDRNDRPDLERQVRLNVPRIGIEMAPDYSPMLHEREYTQWELLS